MAYAVRLRATLDRVEARPDEWDQRHYVLRDDEGHVRYCFAGHAAILAGDPPTVPSRNTPGYYTISGQVIYDVAGRWLGLTNELDELDLFRATNGIERLRHLVATLSKNE